MPRGYLKHVPGESYKRARGGASQRRPRPRPLPTTKDATTTNSKSSNPKEKRGVNKKKHTLATVQSKKNKELAYLLRHYDDELDLETTNAMQQEQEEEDEDSRSSSCTKTASTKKSRVTAAAGTSAMEQDDCPICFECRPVVPMSKACAWHDAACADCLRQIYVVQAQKSVRNYPLRCFHPLCPWPIRETQLQKYGLIHSQAELSRHYRQTELAKKEKRKTTTTTTTSRPLRQNNDSHVGGHVGSWSCSWEVVHCPHCDHPRAYNTHNNGKTNHKKNHVGNNRIFSCRECHQNFMVCPFASLIRAMQDQEGDGDDELDWTLCPECKMLVTREGRWYTSTSGDQEEDPMQCACGATFDWNRANRQSGFRYPFGRPSGDLDPFDVLYLYW